jgi:hypothetical protein
LLISRRDFLKSPDLSWALRVRLQIRSPRRIRLLVFGSNLFGTLVVQSFFFLNSRRADIMLSFILSSASVARGAYTHSSSSLYYNNQHTPIYLRFCCGSVCVCVRVFAARDGGMQPASSASHPFIRSLSRSFSHVFGNFHKIRRAQYFLSAFTARPESYMR